MLCRLLRIVPLVIVSMTLSGHRTSANPIAPPSAFGVRGHAGALDPAFGQGGRVITSVSANRVGDVALQSDGKIVVAGTIDNFNTETFGVFRYLPNGKLDTSFGQGGVVLTASTNANNIAAAIAVQPDGKIVVAGETQSAKIDDFLVARYNPNGTLDRGFGHNGLVTTDFFGFRDDANVVLVQPDGKIIAGGLAGHGSDEQPDELALARYNANGTPDAPLDTMEKLPCSRVTSTHSRFRLTARSSLLMRPSPNGFLQMGRATGA